MKKGILVLVAGTVLLGSFFIFPKELFSEGPTKDREYEIVPTDCLWNIAKRFYNDPWKWKRIWRANPYIVDPDLIYPGDLLILPGIKAVEEEEREKVEIIEEKVPAEEVVSPPEEELIPKMLTEEELREMERIKKLEKYSGTSFIVPEDWHYDGFVVGERMNKTLISMGDTIYLDIGSKDGVVPRLRCFVYRKVREIYHPTTGKFLGYVIRKVGLVEVTREIEEEMCAARVITSYEPIAVGDYIRAAVNR